MEITDVKVRKLEKEGKLRAVASVTFDNDFAVHDIKIIEGQNGLFIAMPSRKTQEGEYRDIAHPINSAYREKLSNLILEQYRNL
ncbi:MAG TPA: septation regulator SpoVG [Clostridia bacterium]|nr:septation regulator SpoVG [Clostridia bacterium]